MSELLTNAEQRRLLQDLLDLIADRARREKSITGVSQSEMETARKEFLQAEQQTTEQFQHACETFETEFQQTSGGITAEFESDFRETQSEFQQVLAGIDRRYDPELSAVTQKHQDAKWLANSVFDESGGDSPQQQFEAFKTQCLTAKDSMDAESQKLADRFEIAHQRMQKRRMGYGFAPENPEGLPSAQTKLRERFDESVREALEDASRLESRFLPKCFSGWRPLGLFLVFGILVFPAALVFQIDPVDFLDAPENIDWSWVSVSGGIGGGMSLILCLVFHGIARSRSSADFQSLLQNRTDAGAFYQKWLKLSKAELQSRKTESEQQQAELIARRDANLARLDEARTIEMEKINTARETELQRANSDYPQRLKTIEADRDSQLKQAEEKRTRQLNTAIGNNETRKRDLSQKQAEQLQECQDRFDRDWSDLTEQWTTGLDRIQTTVSEMNRQCSARFPDFSTIAADSFTLPTALPTVIPFGRFGIDLNQIENGIPEDDRLVPKTTRYLIPALLPFPDNRSFLIEGKHQERRRSIEVLQVIMLRMLTAFPPGKIRFTIFDPVGLGQSFSAFMHLADYDELLINSRIWTNPADMERRLRDITDHMETVFQTYLRNDFNTIQEYNQQAGEVAEPYHVLVMADFPHNMTDDSLRRLMSIATTGSRCGVYTLISIDRQHPLPSNFDFDELKQCATHLVWDTDHFNYQEPGYEWLSLELDLPPCSEHFGKIVRAAGDQSKDVRHIEVPFTRVAPAENRLWSCDSRNGIDVPLGRAGATKLQHLRLGKGTAQHVLVAGRTGSGKSSFLHTLITNVALHYSPDEVEFYLIDFKKGVEFKTYATHLLPHARVIAIESDREFGLSALRRLDSIMKDRGDLFRQHAVQDITSFRNANPETTMPRILLIVDEFQEFFVEDDRLAQDVSLLLDRLVRQGRAFGIHVLLGSQSLAGAYTIARSTLGQIGVRIALQCSDADAHLILSESNTAARLLIRPGEAIYNDANGLVEGNHPFQIAWLPDARREKLLERLQELVREKGFSPELPVIFEGNIPSDPARSPQLVRFLAASTWQRMWSAKKTAAVSYVSVGESVEIKDPAAVVFRRQNGSNLLLVGQSSQSALGILAASFIELATQIDPHDTHSDVSAFPLYVLDGGMPEQRDDQFWKQTTEVVPHQVRLVSPGDSTPVVAEIRAEVKRRNQLQDETSSPIFLFIFNLGRFRDLRKKEDDFGFGSTDIDESMSPGQQLGQILREGPQVGVHTLMWCDTYNNVNRWFTSQTLRELEMRIVFPMNAADSSNLIDSPAASKLGSNRALLYWETQGTVEKFRPYGLPSEKWLAELKMQFGKTEHEPDDG